MVAAKSSDRRKANHRDGGWARHSRTELRSARCDRGGDRDGAGVRSSTLTPMGAKLKRRCIVLEPDRDQIEIFLDALFRYATPGGFLSLRSFFEDRGVGKPFFIIPAKLNGDFKLLCTLTADAARHAANAADKIVFAPPIATFKNGRSATEADIVEALTLSVECDSHPQRGRDRLETRLGMLSARSYPTIIITRHSFRWPRSLQVGACQSPPPTTCCDAC